MRLPSDDHVICFLMEKETKPVLGFTPIFLNQDTALSFELALTRSARPSPSKSAATAQRAPMACCVTTTRRFDDSKLVAVAFCAVLPRSILVRTTSPRHARARILEALDEFACTYPYVNDRCRKD
jgi:hypothetical protein